MALFNKLFFSSSSTTTSAHSTAEAASPSTSYTTSWTNDGKQNHKSQSFHSSSKSCHSNFPFDSGQVRVLVYRECDSRGRRLLFDSNALEEESPDCNGNSEQCLRESIVKSKGSQSNNHDDSANANIQVNSKVGSAKSHKKHFRGSIEGPNAINYKHNRPNSTEITSIGEMVFGSLAMAFRGPALKVHWLHTPSRILLSQVFLSPVSTVLNRESASETRNWEEVRSTTATRDNSLDGYSMNSSFTIPFLMTVGKHLNTIINQEKVSWNSPEIQSSNQCMDTIIQSSRDSGFSRSSGSVSQRDQWLAMGVGVSTSSTYSTKSSLGSSLRSEQESSRKCSLDLPIQNSPLNHFCSDSNFQRRISRNITTSLENKQSLNDFVGFISDHYYTINGSSEVKSAEKSYRRSNCNNETQSNPEIDVRHRHNNVQKSNCLRRAKLGLAVCITMSEFYEEEMESFCGEHIALLESMLTRLRNAIENAYINHREFMQIMLNAWQITTQWINDLFTAPRISSPIWLNITTTADNKNTKNIAERFMKELCWLLSFADTKDTNFFISTVLTAVLTHHLGWVPTVAALSSTSNSKIASAMKEQKAKFLQMSRAHPYNALWAQMGDLYGAIGTPLKLTRTIVYGSERNSIERLLNILTYFIRCGEVCRSTSRVDLSKDTINSIIDQSKTNSAKKTQNGSLTKTQTCKSKLSSLTDMDSNEISNKNEKSNFSFSNLNTEQYDKVSNSKILLTVTSPENIEIPVSTIDEEISEDCALEAIEIDSFDVINSSLVAYKTQTTQKFEQDMFVRENTTAEKKNFFWKMIPPVTEGLSLNDLEKLQEGVKIINRKLEKRVENCTQFHDHDNNDDYTSEKKPDDNNKNCNISNFLNQSNVQKAEQPIYIQPDNVDDAKNSDQKSEKQSGKGVLFVLGGNEPLVNLKKSTDDIAELQSSEEISSSKHQGDRKLCNNHKKFDQEHQQHGIKKHSGVKFNFAQYPQIVTNYMKSKNLHISNYGFLEKSSKMDSVYPSTSDRPECPFPATNSSIDTVDVEDSNCDICKQLNNMRSFQTPSNATELEYETEEEHYYQGGDHRKSIIGNISKNLNESSDASKTLICNSTNPADDVNFLQLPVPDSKDQKDSVSRKSAGFIPSLFLNVSDHYISDMVLQGTVQSPMKWELNLRNDLALSSRSAALISMSAENLAIVADMTTWSVKLISSQTTQALSFSGNMSGPVGMSQLVSAMLEAVHVMYCSGISAYECLSFLESKLQEIYLHSESIAAFLLATDFCSLSDVTTALNLTENDVPLLLSIASIHTPHISNKCGISFK